MICALVIGASGFIGTALCRSLSHRGVSVVPLVSPPQILPGRLRCSVMEASLISALRTYDVDVIFHAAGAGTPYHVGLPTSYHKWANEGTVRATLKAIKATNYQRKVVFLSSASVYGDSGPLPVRESAGLRPCTEYGGYKASAERLLEAGCDHCDLTIARLFHVYGPGQKKLVAYDLTRRAIGGGGPTFSLQGADSIRDFIFIADVVRALIVLGIDLDATSEPRTFNVCSGIATSIAELARMILKSAHVGDRRVLCSLDDALENPVRACVGDPARLASVGITLPSVDPARVAATTDWVRDILHEDSGR